VAIVVVILAVAAVAAYFATAGPSKTSTTSSSSAPTSNTLTVEEQDQPDTLDPAVTYVTPGWEVVDQIYQGLVTYNGSSITSFEGVLASSWTVSGDGMNYTFQLRHDVTFSNGDPFNAYVMW